MKHTIWMICIGGMAMLSGLLMNYAITTPPSFTSAVFAIVATVAMIFVGAVTHDYCSAYDADEIYIDTDEDRANREWFRVYMGKHKGSR